MTKLTEAEIERLCGWTVHPGADPSALLDTVAAIIDARLAPIRAVAEQWDTGCAREVLAALDSASAPVSAQQDHDGTEGQGEGERAGDRDWCPMDEDVTDHTMGDQWQHGDGRYCRHHCRLNAWVFGAYPTTECLRDHERND